MATDYQYYSENFFVYRMPVEDSAKPMDLVAINKMEIWNGKAWMPVKSADDRMTAYLYGMPMDATKVDEAKQITK